MPTTSRSRTVPVTASGCSHQTRATPAFRSQGHFASLPLGGGLVGQHRGNSNSGVCSWKGGEGAQAPPPR